jgi:hypothetical protein
VLALAILCEERPLSLSFLSIQNLSILSWAYRSQRVLIVNFLGMDHNSDAVIASGTSGAIVDKLSFAKVGLSSRRD